MKSYLKRDNVAPLPPPNFILFQLDFDVKFLLLRPLLILNDLKSTIIRLHSRFPLSVLAHAHISLKNIRGV